jgi:hypothetical protein
LTVIVKVCGVPVQPFTVGVTVMVAITGAAPGLIAANAAMFPLPLAASPIEGVLFTQLKVVPLTEPEKITAAVFAPLHKV